MDEILRSLPDSFDIEPSTIQTQVHEIHNSSSPVVAALRYAESGWHVFPLHHLTLDGKCSCGKTYCERGPGKHPRTLHGYKDASNDAQVIREWWHQWPQANIGIATGPSGLVVVDMDPRHGGDVTLKCLVDEHGDVLTDTVRSRTGGGGNHFYFAAPEVLEIRSSAGTKLGEGMDVRAIGGYVIAPPSQHMSGQSYRWDEGHSPEQIQVKPLPDALVALLTAKSPRKAARTARSSVPASSRQQESGLIRDGQRNTEMYSIGSLLRNSGYSEAELYEHLLKVDEDRCEVPLSGEGSEIEKIAHNAAKYPPSHPQTDMGNASRLLDHSGKDLRFSEGIGWLVWDGKRFIRDTSSEVQRRAQQTVRAIQVEAQRIPDEGARNSLSQFGRKSESAPRLNAIVQTALSQPTINIGMSALDTTPYLLNVGNGTLDLRSGQLREHRREDLLTKAAPVNYDPDAECPLFHQFLQRITGGDETLIGFLQRVFGYCLTGDIGEQCLFLFHGDGANGKSTLLNTVSRILGTDYSRSCRPDLFIVRQSTGTPSELAEIARLQGARLVTTAEPEENQRLAESLVKQITGGENLTGKFMHQNPFEYRPEFKVVMATNHLPVIQGDDAGIWRRLLVVPFNVQIPEGERDPQLEKKLQKEAPGILRWMVEGCREWQNRGLAAPEVIRQAGSAYRRNSDSVRQFVDEMCVNDPFAKLAFQHLWSTYLHWCEEQGETPVTKTKFGPRLTRMGYLPEKSRLENGPPKAVRIGIAFRR